MKQQSAVWVLQMRTRLSNYTNTEVLPQKKKKTKPRRFFEKWIRVATILHKDRLTVTAD